MKAFGRFAILTTLAVYFLIFVGGLVRVSGAGLGCPDWPKCFGRWIPPLSINQIPPDMDPSAFNMTLAWIEYINRLIGMTVGLLVLAVAIWAIIGFRKNKGILIASILAALFTAYQGWQGSQVVASGLKPLIVSAHLVIALIIAGLMIYVSLRAYYLSRSDVKGEYSKGARLHAGVLLVIVLIQIILGTMIRAAIEIVLMLSPLISPGEALTRSGILAYTHSGFGIIIMILALLTSHKLLAKSPSSLVWQTSWTMAGLAILQVIFGLILFLGGVPPVARVLHMWISALLFGVTLIAFFAARREGSAV